MGEKERSAPRCGARVSRETERQQSNRVFEDYSYTYSYNSREEMK